MDQDITLEELGGLVFEPQEFEADNDLVFTPETTAQEEVVNTPAVEPTPVEEAPAPVTYKTSAPVKFLLDSGLIPDLTVEVDGQTIKLSESENFDEELLKQVLATYKEEQEKDNASRFIDTKDMSDEQKNMFRLIKSRDAQKIQELFDTPEEIFEPATGYDKTNAEHNRQVLYHHYKTVNGLSHEEAVDMLTIAEKHQTADVKAEAIVETYRQEYKEKLANKAKEAEDNVITEKEAIKAYSKSLETQYSEKQLPKEVINKIISLATKKGKDGLLLIDEVFEAQRKDPAQAAELLLFMTDRELYNSRITSEAKKDENLKNARTIKIVSDPNRGTKTSTNTVNEPTVDEKDLLGGLVFND